jgi:diguanylate cyclase (GGDEF)-like protein
MREGIYEALRPLGSEAQRQVVLVTDGLIGFESEVVAAVATRLPAGCRVHTVGVGSSVNRSLTSPIARAGHGVEVVLGLGEDPERAARRIVLRTDAPLVVDLSLDGSALLEHAPRCLPDLFGGAPALVAVKLRPEGGELVVRGRTDAGAWEERVTVPAIAPGSGTPSGAQSFARELVEDLEVEVAAGADRPSLDASIESVGVDLQLATRLTSWVAIGDVASDGLGKKHHQRVPQEIPHGMSVEGLGLRGPMPTLAASAPMYAPRAAPPPPRSALPSPASPSYYDGGDMEGDDDDKSIVGKNESAPPPRVSRRPVGGPAVAGSEPPDGEEKTRVTTVVQRYKKAEEDGGPSTDFLVIINTKEPTLLGKRFALRDSELRVGRGAENDVVLDGDSVSRRHARFEKKGLRWMCVDEGSTNGTYVGDDQIARERALANGDRIKVGGTIFKYLSGADVEAQYHEEIYRMSIIDGLTQAYVKRYVLEALDKEILRARRHTRDLAVLMMDIDHFKNVNDQHGHLAGDYILKEVAKVVLDRIRKDEVFARYGGEEFCMVLPETSAENAAHLAEELRQKIAAAVFTFQNEQIKVTISIGVAALPAGEAHATQTGQDLVRRADAKLYEAKRGGRNRVVA